MTCSPLLARLALRPLPPPIGRGGTTSKGFVLFLEKKFCGSSGGDHLDFRRTPEPASAVSAPATSLWRSGSPSGKATIPALIVTAIDPVLSGIGAMDTGRRGRSAKAIAPASPTIGSRSRNSNQPAVRGVLGTANRADQYRYLPKDRSPDVCGVPGRRLPCVGRGHDESEGVVMANSRRKWAAPTRPRCDAGWRARSARRRFPRYEDLGPALQAVQMGGSVHGGVHPGEELVGIER